MVLTYFLKKESSCQTHLTFTSLYEPIPVSWKVPHTHQSMVTDSIPTIAKVLRKSYSMLPPTSLARTYYTH